MRSNKRDNSEASFSASVPPVADNTTSLLMPALAAINCPAVVSQLPCSPASVATIGTRALKLPSIVASAVVA